MTITLTSKTALITGASRGIGEATAQKLAEYGANVVLAARSLKDIERIAAKIGNKAVAVQCDVTRYEDLENAVQTTQNHFGNLDILVNNAGTIEPISRLETSDPDEWSHVVDINLKGVYYGLRAAYPAMEKTGGVIVNLSSGAATSALEGWSHYCATKAAVLSLTRCAHKEWNHLGIHVVGLSPGTVATDMQAAIKASGINPVSQLDWPTHISPEWVGKAIAWLASDAGRKHDGTDFSLKNKRG